MNQIKLKYTVMFLCGFRLFGFDCFAHSQFNPWPLFQNSANSHNSFQKQNIEIDFILQIKNLWSEPP